MNSTDIILTAVSTTRVILFRNARHFAIESLVLLFDLLFLSLLKCFCNAVITSFMAMQIKLIVVVVSSNLDLLLQKHFLYLTSSSNKSSRPCTTTEPNKSTEHSEIQKGSVHCNLAAAKAGHLLSTTW